MTSTGAETEVARAIKSRLADARVRVQWTEWGYVVEVIHPMFAEGSDEAHGQLRDLLRAAASAAAHANDVIWKVCTAKDERSAFSVNATLRTIESGPDANGIFTSTLTIADAYVSLTEFETELLYASATTEVVAIETPNEMGDPLLPFKSHSRYVSLEFGAQQYRVKSAIPEETGGGRRIRISLRIDN